MRQLEPRPAPGAAVSLPASAFDMLPLGIAKTDRDGCLTYANRKMLQMGGLDDWRGRTLADLFRGRDLETVQAELKSRFEKRAANAYPAILTRKDGTVVPVSITAFPETDENDKVVGTLALLRDLTVERAQQGMYELVERESDGDRLLDAIGAALAPLVPFDRLQVIRLNKERTHLRTIYPRDERAGAPARSYRWWRIPEAIRGLLDGKRLVINDLEAWYRDPERVSMLKDPAVQQFLAEGFVSTMSLPVSLNGAHAASIVLSRQGGRPFTTEEEAIADALPLTEAVSVALRNETEGNLKFLLDLMAHISTAYESVAQVAQTLVEKISEHYDWDYVSIYQVYEERGEIRLIAQQAKRDDLRSRTSSYPIDEGIIGQVFRDKKGVNFGNLDAPELSGIRIKRHKETLSELCVPIGDDGRWLLNVEDEHSNAFAPEEMADVQAIAAGLRSLLKRTLDYHYRSAIFSHANDAILLVDERGHVFEVNPAAASLLRLPKEQLEGGPVEPFFADPEEARTLLNGDSFPNHEVVMRRGGAGGEPVKVLLSVARLPDETGGRIFVASDMTQIERVEQLELAQGLYREITGQVKTPMSLAISWLRRYGQRNRLGADDVSHKAVQQLQKAELTLDRLMLVERDDRHEVRHEVLISMDDLVQSILLDMPDRERETIDRTGEAGPVFVRADAYELRYGLQTVLSYLLRLAAEVDRIGLDVRRERSEVIVVASGRAESPQADIDAECRSGQARAEMSLGRTTLARLAQRNRGRYIEEWSPVAGQQANFGFAFPVVGDGEGR